MKRNRIWPYLGIGAISVLILALMLTVLPAGAATSGGVQGVQGDLTILDKPASDKESQAIVWVSPDGMDSFVHPPGRLGPGPRDSRNTRY